MTSVELPTPGRIVHFVLSSGTHRAALVVSARPAPDGQGALATLDVHLDGTRDTPQLNFGSTTLPDPVVELFPPPLKGLIGQPVIVQVCDARYDEGGGPGTWHYDEDVPAPS